MKFKRGIISLLSTISLAKSIPTFDDVLGGSAVSYDDHQVYQVMNQAVDNHSLDSTGEHNLQQIFFDFERKHKISLWSLKGQEATFSCQVDHCQSINWVFRNLNYKVTLLHDNLQSLISLQNVQVFNHQVFNAPKSFHSKYHTYDELVAFYRSLAIEFPHIIKEFTIGKTFEKREIIGFTFTSPNSTTTKDKPEILYHGAIHAREWIGPAMLTFVAEQLVRSNDPEILALLETFKISIIPVLNVDGYIYTHKKDRMWRKNREPTSSFWCMGTDVNRNFDAGWSGPGASSNPCSEAYYGPKAFSAPEGRAISNYILEKKVLSYIDWHAYSQLFMFPYGYDCKKTTKMDKVWEVIAEKTALSIKSVHGTEFQTGPICKTIYEASGSSVDWAFDSANVKYPFAVELRDTGRYGFLLPAKFIIPVGEEILTGIKTMLALIKEQEKL